MNEYTENNVYNGKNVYCTNTGVSYMQYIYYSRETRRPLRTTEGERY